MKKEHLKMLQSIQELQVKPLNLLIRRVLERLRRKDPAEIFAEPVSIDEVCGSWSLLKGSERERETTYLQYVHMYMYRHVGEIPYFMSWPNKTFCIQTQVLCVCVNRLYMQLWCIHTRTCTCTPVRTL